MNRMVPVMSRRECLLAGPAVAGVLAGLAMTRRARCDETPSLDSAPALPASFPAQDPRVVSEMVGVSHGRVARVRELLALAPQLANASWDLGFGDWETALGAASHVGNREIAALLIEHGARPDLFTFAMLGNLDAVRSIVTAQPGIQRLRGPHGLTLAHHARAGGGPAAAVVEYLAGMDGADERAAEVELSAAARDAILGTYAWGDAPDQRLRVWVPEKRTRPVIARGSGGGQGLIHLGIDLGTDLGIDLGSGGGEAGPADEYIFHPTGAPDVRVRFVVAGGRATALNITTPAPLLHAGRVE